VLAEAVRWLRGRTGRRAHRAFRARLLVQTGFALTCVLIGVQFARFVRAAQQGALPLPPRPPGVEGFLPISGLMGLVDWIHQGTLNTIHPAATVLVLTVVATALLLRKAFCSWICPVGLLSDLLAALGRKLFGRTFRPWRWLDVPLRGLKYLLLAFFLYSILTMGEVALRFFLESPYNRVADVKMGLFFVRLSAVGAAVLALLVVASVLVQGFWCRYLCPYGALLGLFSWASPVRVKRNPTSCIDCKLCDKACMARLPVSSSASVLSVECTGCLDCVAVCPVKDALALQAGPRRVGVLAYAVAIVLLFLAGYSGARLAGLWQNGIGDAEYVQRVRAIDTGGYGHPGMGSAKPRVHRGGGRGQVPAGSLDDGAGVRAPREGAALTRP
jgi:polyferredoxin